MEIFECKTDIGLIRETNEDATLVLNHPKNKNVKLMLVADGMGGKEYGEIAANYVATSLSKWFSNKDIKTLNDIEKTEQYIKIKNLNMNNLDDLDSLYFLDKINMKPKRAYSHGKIIPFLPINNINK